MKKQIGNLCGIIIRTLGPYPLTDDATKCSWYVRTCDYLGLYARIAGLATLSGFFSDDAPPDFKYISVACYSLAIVLQNGIVKNSLHWNRRRNELQRSIPSEYVQRVQ